MKLLLRLLSVLSLLTCFISVSLFAQSVKHLFNGQYYTWPSTHGSGTLVNDGSGNLSWSGGVLGTNIVAWSTTGSCPAGWSEYTAARGRYIVGLNTGGTPEATVGTALTDEENRATGTHSHTSTTTVTLNDPGHTHSVTDPQHRHADAKTGGTQGDAGGGSGDMLSGNNYNTNSATTGITINASASGAGLTATATPTINTFGSVAGTNAPYVQRIVCKKN